MLSSRNSIKGKINLPKTSESLFPGREVFYWKSHHGEKEVDFVVKEGLAVKKVIQVCWDISNEKTRKREISSLLKAIEDFNLKEGLILTEDYEGEELVKGKKIIYLALWKWLIDDY